MIQRDIDEAFDLFVDIPDICQKQIEVQRESYHSLINRMNTYDWYKLFSDGVKIDEKDGDPQVFLTRLLSPVRICVFIPDNTEYKVRMKTLPSLLEQHLKSMDIYMGPLSQKITTTNGEEIQNPFRLFVDKKERLVRIICI